MSNLAHLNPQPEVYGFYNWQDHNDFNTAPSEQVIDRIIRIGRWLGGALFIISFGFLLGLLVYFLTK